MADVDATQNGADLVSAYMSDDFIETETQLRSQGKVDMLIPLVSSVASHIHLIDVILTFSHHENMPL